MRIVADHLWTVIVGLTLIGYGVVNWGFAFSARDRRYRRGRQPTEETFTGHHRSQSLPPKLARFMRMFTLLSLLFGVVMVIAGARQLL